MPCSITFPGPAEGSPVQSSGTQPYAMFVPPENFLCGADFIGEDKAAPSCHAALSSFWTYCVRVSIPGAYRWVLRPGIRYQASAWRRAGKHRLTEKAGSIRIPREEKRDRLIRQWSAIQPYRGARYETGIIWCSGSFSVLRHPAATGAGNLTECRKVHSTVHG